MYTSDDVLSKITENVCVLLTTPSLHKVALQAILPSSLCSALFGHLRAFHAFQECAAQLLLSRRWVILMLSALITRHFGFRCRSSTLPVPLNFRTSLWMVLWSLIKILRPLILIIWILIISYFVRQHFKRLYVNKAINVKETNLSSTAPCSDHANCSCTFMWSHAPHFIQLVLRIL